MMKTKLVLGGDSLCSISMAMMMMMMPGLLVSMLARAPFGKVWFVFVLFDLIGSLDIRRLELNFAAFDAVKHYFLFEETIHDVDSVD
jgi:hypothetical protein